MRIGEDNVVTVIQDGQGNDESPNGTSYSRIANHGYDLKVWDNREISTRHPRLPAQLRQLHRMARTRQARWLHRVSVTYAPCPTPTDQAAATPISFVEYSMKVVYMASVKAGTSLVSPRPAGPPATCPRASRLAAQASASSSPPLTCLSRRVRTRWCRSSLMRRTRRTEPYCS